ncbi:hypothetical protein [Cognatilysobacter lacus]|uniref:Uncharacterized protein n=1 Tax=Cognatilysobacter lacus TaxID=1643323 RepID=A0A5D8YND7_9GAMM|nr:hypothetical protein [Lysobacter lacus]TZF84285.1 hypothetical protein FW784_12760 [Lysobacter lacus]
MLAQRGNRICGTWSYYATGYYDGRVVATTRSPTEARRIFVCGRPGSETSKECEQGWEAVDKPLRLCGDKLGDLDSERGGCYADFARVSDAHGEMEALQKQPWMQACLTGNPAEGAR